jgi:hypothetical protein
MFLLMKTRSKFPERRDWLETAKLQLSLAAPEK